MKKILIDPFNNPNLLNNKIFDSPFNFLKTSFFEMDYELDTYDLGNLKNAEKILFLNLNKELLKECIKNNIDKEKMILFLWEPRCVIPDQYNIKYWKYFNKILTFRNDLIDNNKIFLMHYPQGQTILKHFKSFEERRLLTLINANKFSYVEGELYSMRRSIIKFCEREKVEFDLYGFDWEINHLQYKRKLLVYLKEAIKNRKAWTFVSDVVQSFKKFKTYKGRINDKYEMLNNYRYCICIENEETWITEKLFDCFFTGTVPIYYGPKIINKYITPDIFIDLRNFATYKDLLSYLKTITLDEFERIQSAGTEFIQSQKFEIWKPENVFKNISKVILSH